MHKFAASDHNIDTRYSDKSHTQSNKITLTQRFFYTD